MIDVFGNPETIVWADTSFTFSLALPPQSQLMLLTYVVPWFIHYLSISAKRDNNFPSKISF
jgi:hypothetical protein